MSMSRQRIFASSCLAGLLALALACGEPGAEARGLTSSRPLRPAPCDILSKELPAALLGMPYQAWIEPGHAGAEEQRFELTGGSLPGGLDLDQVNGIIHGVPVDSGDFACIVRWTGPTTPSPFVHYLIRIEVRLPPAPRDPLPKLEAGRSSGVAPLAVFFDASATTSPGVPRPFHDLHYSWTFSDPGSPIQRATGPLAYHLFERPGLYRVQLSVREPGGGFASDHVVIQVEDPEVIFAGARTLCFANNDDFTGAPKDARRIVTSCFDTLMRYAGTGVRLLLRRGDSFTSSASHALRFEGPFHLGAFGAGQSPDARGIFANNPLVLISGNTPLLRPGGADQRVTDLVFRASPGLPGPLIEAAYRVERFLLDRLTIEGFDMAACIHHDLIRYYRIDPHDQVAVTRSLFLTGAGNCFYTGGTRLAIAGNEFRGHGGPQSHLLRVTFADRALISGNLFTGNAGSRHCIKLHAPPWSAGPVYSERVLLTGNEFESAVTWMVTLGPQDSGSDERVREALVEKNTFRPAPGARVCLYVNSAATTIRNNVFQDTREAPAGDGYIYVGRRGIEPAPSEVAIFHNTAYCDHALGGERVLARLAEHLGGPIPLKNNLLCAPLMPRVRLWLGPAGVADAGNLILIDPRFAAPCQGDFSLLNDSPAIGAGVDLPVLDDFEGSQRPAPGTHPDTGAYEHH